MARRKKRSRTRKPGDHRQAPRPASWDCPRGTCRFCGEPIIEGGVQNNRKHWHQACADRWKVMNSPTEARKLVFRREKGICQCCGFKSLTMKDFQVDHIKPLFEADGDPSYYESTNMQLLCHPCHKEKTKIDMVRYRGLKDPTGIPI